MVDKQVAKKPVTAWEAEKEAWTAALTLDRQKDDQRKADPAAMAPSEEPSPSMLATSERDSLEESIEYAIDSHHTHAEPPRPSACAPPAT